ncbi:hypothetical protein LJR225_003379 [Phenylobacterium sp. LjRoot225]|uniref:hypothetical protein n=1 Tax=Phenylobacterium sp. LjRoot225 TaxID=3342285 RepID=UPI003ECC33F8
MKFNMGCGHNHAPGWVNVDAFAEAAPDEVCNLDQTPWPWPDNCADEVRFIHSLEHMGGDPKVFLAIMQELYRISAPGCRIEIYVPHPHHDFFLNDPTHVRAITPNMLMLFDRELNDQWKAAGVSNSPLAHYTGVDFQITSVVQVPAFEYRELLNAGELDEATFYRYAAERLNVIEETRITMTARKPAFGVEPPGRA